MKPSTEVEMTGDDAARMQKLIDAIESLDDVQDVYTNAVIDDVARALAVPVRAPRRRARAPHPRHRSRAAGDRASASSASPAAALAYVTCGCIRSGEGELPDAPAA